MTNRFSEQPAADLAGNYVRHMALHVWGDDLTPKFEALRCGSCGQVVDELFPCEWDRTIEVGACCVVDLDGEPECSCSQSDVDLFDASACEYHNPNSQWNARLRAVTAFERYESSQGKAA